MPPRTEYVAVAREGERFLLALAADLAAGNTNGDAFVHDLLTGQKTERQPLQVWFKWAAWEECTDADYRAALEASDQR